jgi:hypothetical protein
MSHKIFFLNLIIFFYSGCKDPAPAQPKNPAPPPAESIEPAIKPKAPSVGELAMAADSLDEILGIIRPHLQDTMGELDPGAVLLASWMSNHISWKALQSLRETNIKKVLKDPESERGNLLCKKGRIVEIQVDRSLNPPVYIGGMILGNLDVIRFIAVGDTGELVEGKRSLFCGVVTGRFSYSNAMGGVTHSVQTVGLFDLKSNKAFDLAITPVSTQ